MSRNRWALWLLVGILLITATACGKKPEADKTADVIVVGGGGAGLAAAVSAAENGRCV